MKSINLLLIIAFTILLECMCKSDKVSQKLDTYSIKTDKENSYLKDETCIVPKEILEFIKKNNSSFQLINENNFPLIDKSIKCPFITTGDFNNNGKLDLALIVINKSYKAKGYGDHQFPFLLIFNDYKDKNTQTPFIIVKSDEYAQDAIQTVIYDQFEDGILSYIEKDFQCNQDVVKITIPEKSVFYIIWDETKQTYNYFHSTDLDCKNNVQNSNSTDYLNALKVSWNKNRLNNIDTINIEEDGNKISVIQENQWINAPIEYEIKQCQKNNYKIILTYLGNSITGKIYTIQKNNEVLNLKKIETYTVGGSNVEICENIFNKNGFNYQVRADKEGNCYKMNLENICK